MCVVAVYSIRLSFDKIFILIFMFIYFIVWYVGSDWL